MRLHAPFHFITPADRQIQQQKKETSFTGMFPFLLGYSDSNQEKQDQNLLCYHYTIAQNHRLYINLLF